MPPLCYPNTLRDDVDLNVMLASLSLTPGAAQDHPNHSVTGADEDQPEDEYRATQPGDQERNDAFWASVPKFNQSPSAYTHKDQPDDEYRATRPGDQERNNAFWASIPKFNQSPSACTSLFSRALTCNITRSNLCIFVIPTHF